MLCDDALRVLAGAPSALVTETEAIEAWGLDTAAGVRLVATLIDDGLLDVWGREDGVALVLSPLAAARCGVDLLVAGDTDSIRWVPAGSGKPEPRRRKGKGPALECEAFDPERSPAGLDSIADPRARRAGDGGRLDHPAAAEHIEARGYGASTPVNDGFPWPVARLEPGAPCPVCHGRALRKHECCIMDGCDRVGVKLPPIPIGMRPGFRGSGLPGGRGKAKAGKGPKAGPKRKAG